MKIKKQQKKKTDIMKLVVIMIISLAGIISALFLLTYFRIINIPFITSILSSMVIDNSNENVSEITFQDFDEKDIAFDNGELYVKSQLLITADSSFTYDDIKKAVMNYGGNIVGAIQFTNDYQIEFDNKSYDELNNIAESLKNDLSGSDVSLHKVFYENEEKTSNSNDETNDDWWREAIWLTKLEEDNNTYSNVNVGIFDNMFDTNNTDLTGLFAKEWQNTASGAENSHGTEVAGLIAARKNNNYGIDGVSSNSTLYGFSYSGNNLNEYVTSEMKYKFAIALMLNEGVKIINFSNGYDEMMAGAKLGITSAENDLKEFSEALSKFLTKYIDNGYDFIITKAAGNINNKTWIKCDVSSSHPYGIKVYNSDEDGKLDKNNKFDDTLFTAEYDIFGTISDEKVKNRIIMIGSISKSGDKYKPNDDSVRGDRVDVYAPGDNISCLVPKIDKNNNMIYTQSGTSFSAPIVAGVASLVWGINPGLSSEQVKNVIKEKTLYNIEGESKKLINAFYAVRYSQNLRNQGSSNKNNTGTVMGLIRATSEDDDILYISGAKIDFTKSGETTVVEAVTTDDYGNFDVVLYSGTYTMTVSHDGYKVFSKSIDLQEGDVVYLDDIFLSRDNRVYFGEYSLIIPSNWIYEQHDRDVYFYEKSIYDISIDLGYTAPTGIIVIINKCYSEADVSNIPIRHKLLGDKDGVYYVAIYPSDVEVPTELMQSDEELFNSLNEKLHNERENSENVLATFEWTNESTAKNTSTTIKDSENELKDKLGKNANKSILNFYYDDFDSNGEYAAFAVVGESDEDNWYTNADVWFISCDTSKVMKNIYGYANGLLNAENFSFVSLESSAHGSETTSFVFV